MQEKLLHFVWQYQYFSPDRLTTETGETVQVLFPGEYNQHAGPDFLFALLRIDGMEWRGHVEIHVSASDWEHHNHHLDPAYDAVILHVVWENDKQVFRAEGTSLPTIVLRDNISLSVFRRYTDLSESLWHIPCHDAIHRVPSIVLEEERVASFRQRMIRKTSRVRDMLEACEYDWEQTAFRLLLRYAGSGENKDAFDRLSRLLRYAVLKRHADRPDQVEALMLGAAGFLRGKPRDPYQGKLTTEFEFLQKKYEMSGIEPHEWKFLRMRPASFPTRRIAALSLLLSTRHAFFSNWLELDAFRPLLEYFKVEMTAYWQNHSTFGRKGKMPPAGFGRSQSISYLINVIFPLKITWHAHHHRTGSLDLAMNLYKQLPAENNRYIRIWNEAGVINRHAADTQAMLGLFHQKCRNRKCLDCRVGIEILSE